MPRYKITPAINNGGPDAPPIEIEVDEDMNTPEGVPLGDLLVDEMCNDYGTPFGKGFTLTVERLDQDPSPFKP